jgi:hypothetical protein
VIVRIAGEGQYRLPDADAQRLNELDNQAVAAAEAGEQERFLALFGDMLRLVERDGQELSSDELMESDVILPPRDTTFEEARHDFSGEGLIPD